MLRISDSFVHRSPIILLIMTQIDNGKVVCLYGESYGFIINIKDINSSK